MSQKFILITGCSGGGKSTLIRMLDEKGFHTVPEPGRRIVADEMKHNGKALPWIDLRAFALRAVDMAREDLQKLPASDYPVFFDRGLIDAAVALQFAGGASYSETLGEDKQYSQRVFLAPPWPEIFHQDDERKHNFSAAEEEYYRIKDALEELNYDICLLPKISVEQRVEFVLRSLERNN